MSVTFLSSLSFEARGLKFCIQISQIDAQVSEEGSFNIYHQFVILKVVTNIFNGIIKHMPTKSLNEQTFSTSEHDMENKERE